MQIKTVQNTEDLLKCWEAVNALRPALSKEDYLKMYVKMQKESYRIIFVENEFGKVVAIAGFRYMTTYYGGKNIYIDDLSTIPSARGRGYASALLDYIISLANEQLLDGVHLDSGHQRFDAHRLYLSKKFNIASHHFKLDLK